MPMIQNEAELKMNEFLQYLPSTLKLGGYAGKYQSVLCHIMTFNTDKNNNVCFEGLVLSASLRY
jgi:hypothetical protein